MTVSVVICCYTEDRWHDVVEAVKSLLGQTVAPDEVVLVVDHNPELLDRAVSTFDGVRVVPNTHCRGLSGARNTGVELATGEIVAFLDDDARAEPEWLARLLAPYADQDVAAVGGRALPLWPAETAPPQLPPELYWVVGCGFTGQPAELSEVRNLMGCAMSLRREIVLALGGFAEQLGRTASVPLGCEETELCIRLRQRIPSAKVLLEPEATVRHRVSADRVGWRYLRRRSWSEGMSKAAISRMVGQQDALSTEQSYVRTVITRALGRSARIVVTGKPMPRSHGLAAMGGLLLATSAAGLGYVTGRLRRTTPVAAAVAPAPVRLDEWPRVSVVVATAGRVELVDRCVRSVLATGYPDLEVLVVDNHRGGPNAELVELATIDDRVRYLREPVPGASRARNLGAAQATGSVLAFTDDDAVVDRNWLTGAISELSVENVDCVTGLVLPLCLDTPAQEWFEAFGGFGKGEHRRVYGPHVPAPDPLYPLSPGIFGSGNNMVWLRTAFASLGGFDERLGPGTRTRAGEDLDLFLRLITSGGRLTYTPDALVWHEHRATLPELRSQLRGYGTGLAAMFLLHATRRGGFSGIAHRLPRGLRKLLDPGSERNSQRTEGFPRQLVLDELRGMAAAPVALMAEILRRRRA